MLQHVLNARVDSHMHFSDAWPHRIQGNGKELPTCPTGEREKAVREIIWN